MPLIPTEPDKQKKLLIGLIPLLLLFAYWFGVHGGKTEEIAAMESRLQTLETRNATARVRAGRGAADLEERLALYEQHIAQLETLVPSSEEVPELLHDMTLRAQENGVEIAMVRPQSEEPGPFYTLRTYDVAVFGGYHDVGRFLASIGSLPRIVTPGGLSMKARKVGPDGAELQARFRIRTYVLPPPAAPVEAQSNART